jgi:hypothetical protein
MAQSVGHRGRRRALTQQNGSVRMPQFVHAEA